MMNTSNKYRSDFKPAKTNGDSRISIYSGVSLRTMISTLIAAGIRANPIAICSSEELAEVAIKDADALIERLNKNG